MSAAASFSQPAANPDHHWSAVNQCYDDIASQITIITNELHQVDTSMDENLAGYAENAQSHIAIVSEHLSTYIRDTCNHFFPDPRISSHSDSSQLQEKVTTSARALKHVKVSVSRMSMRLSALVVLQSIRRDFSEHLAEHVDKARYHLVPATKAMSDVGDHLDAFCGIDFRSDQLKDKLKTEVMSFIYKELQPAVVAVPGFRSSVLGIMDDSEDVFETHWMHGLGIPSEHWKVRSKLIYTLLFSKTGGLTGDTSSGDWRHVTV